MFPVKNHTRIEEMLQADVRDDLSISEFDPTAPARSSTEQIRLFEPVKLGFEAADAGVPRLVICLIRLCPSRSRPSM